MTQCRYCWRDVIWALTESGKRIPVNPMPDPRGDKLVFTDERGLARAFHDANRGDATHHGWTPTPDRYTCHLDTCTRDATG